MTTATELSTAVPDSGLHEWEGKYLAFSIDREEYAVPIQKVREIIGVSPIAPLPNLPMHIKGVLNLRGSVVPIIDLRIKYGLVGRDYDDRTCIVVLELDGEHSAVLMGVVVDSVNEVLRILPGKIAPPPFEDGPTGNFLTGVTTDNGRVTILLDIEQALADDAFYADMGL